MKSGASSIASAPREAQESFLTGLSNEALRALPYLFEFWAMPHQLPPEGDWRTWVILGGRGAGKTRAGAEWVRSEVEGPGPRDTGRSRHVAIVGETLDQARDVMIFGPSGIIACSPPDRKPVWEATRRRLIWPNGATATLYSAHDYERLRGPQFDAAWIDEMGCPAIDKGTNAPEPGGVPRDTTGARDDLVQMQYLAAQAAHWDDPEENPVSGVYGGPMVATDRMFVRGWDARPYPQFPATVSVWADGGDYALGHWLPGRMASRSLGSVVADVCRASGVTEFDVSGLFGVVRGVAVEGGSTGRAALQPLLMAAGADAVERDGKLVFRSRTARVTAEIDAGALALGEGAEVVSHLREPEAEMAGRVQVSFLEADGDYEVRAVEARFPDAAEHAVARSELPIVLTQGEGRALSERWLSEVQVARESVRFALPPSSPLVAGDVVAFRGAEDGARYRIDRIEEGGARLAEAVRIDAGTFSVAADAETVVARAPALAPLPVTAHVMDLPFIGEGDGVAAPWVAAASEPWQGDLSVYARQGDAWRYLADVTRRAMIGETLTPMSRAVPGLWDRGPALRLRLVAGALSSVDERALFSGGNAAIIQGPGGGPWEVFQFRDAVLTGPDTWDLGMRLRGQQGTEGAMPAVWPEGSRVIVTDAAFLQLTLRASERGIAKSYRIGPAAKPVDHPAFVEIEAVTEGLALRPYAPAHLGAAVREDGAVEVAWVRRTRIDGDRWEALDVPLGEADERYLVRVFVGTSLRREATVTAPGWTYGAAERSADGAGGRFRIAVAQISDRFGPGVFQEVEIDD